jgi:hypothetical protein
MLKFGAVDFEDGARIANKRLRSRFHEACLSGSGWTEEKKVTDRTTGARHAGQKRLVDIYNLIDCFFLADYQLLQIAVKLFCLAARLQRVQLFI